jgi:hypothetical protein
LAICLAILVLALVSVTFLCCDFFPPTLV